MSVSFEHAYQLLQGLTTLSPRRLERLIKGPKTSKFGVYFIGLHSDIATHGLKSCLTPLLLMISG